jgi:membrane protease YdiL (CAAX protease family)
MATDNPVSRPAAADRKRDSGLIVLWLAMWAISVGTFAVRQWWIIALCTVSLWWLTWRVSHSGKAALVFLRPVTGKVLTISTLAGLILFLVFFFCIEKAHLHVQGHIPLTLAIWSTFISPVNEELVFRGLLYRGFQIIGETITKSRWLEVFIVLATGIVFGLAHAREFVFFLMTMVAGVLYGVVRWGSGSVLASICCHKAYNGLALLLLSR